MEDSSKINRASYSNSASLVAFDRKDNVLFGIPRNESTYTMYSVTTKRYYILVLYALI